MRIVIPILFMLVFILSACNNILGEIEEIETGIRCNELGGGDSVDTLISETCKDTCLSNVMKYTPDYRCHATSFKLICSCIVTPERKEQLKIMKEQTEIRELNEKCESLCEPECKKHFDTNNPTVGEPFYLAVPIETRDDFYCYCGCMNRGLWVDTKAVKR